MEKGDCPASLVDKKYAQVFERVWLQAINQSIDQSISRSIKVLSPRLQEDWVAAKRSRM